MNLHRAISDTVRMSQNEMGQAADATGKVLLGVGGTLVVGLIAALVGGALGVARRPRSRIDTRVVEVPVVPTEPPTEIG